MCPYDGGHAGRILTKTHLFFWKVLLGHGYKGDDYCQKACQGEHCQGYMPRPFQRILHEGFQQDAPVVAKQTQSQPKEDDEGILGSVEGSGQN